MAQYELSREKVEHVSFHDSSYEYYVIVKLTESSGQEFAQLTEENMGKRVEITYLGQVLYGATVRERVETGLMKLEHWSSKEEARRFVEALQ